METKFDRWISEMTNAPPPPVSDVSAFPSREKPVVDDRSGGLRIPPCAVCLHARGAGCHYLRWKGIGAIMSLAAARERCPMIYG